MKEDVGRVSIPGRIVDLLLSDDEFYREVSSLKKASTSGRFPKCDQWCDSTGFHMAFALAGYSSNDIEIYSEDCMLIVRSNKGSSGSESTKRDSESGEPNDYPVKPAHPQIQQGMIVRGIARRNFRARFFIRPEFDLKSTKARMNNGLLEITIPKRLDEYSNSINIDVTRSE
jgi:HSP20 family molecular chaperone IbpA|tara:strand:- start:18678 stop:19193 length:516 start_codon:yes stop_codon:yes gene_type:complete